MSKKLVLVSMIAVLLIMNLMSVFQVSVVKAPNGTTIHIKEDGSIDPPDAPIVSPDNITYYLTSNIVEKSIVVERDNITIKGFNRVVQGNTSLKTGIDLSNRKNVTLEEVKVTKFSYGILLNNSRDNELRDVISVDNWAGVWIESSLRTMLYHNNFSDNNMFGISIRYSGNNELHENIALGNYDGISLWMTSGETLYGNNASLNRQNGIKLYAASANFLWSNIANSNQYYGVSLYESDNNYLSGNNASNNRFNFGVEGEDYWDFTTNRIDTFNFVDGKPVYYIKSTDDSVIDATTDAGTVYLINCNNMTVKNLNLTKNANGVFFWNTTNSRIKNVTALSNQYGVCFDHSDNNTVSYNNLTGNNYGILFKNSSSCTVLWNTIKGNNNGIYLNWASYNRLFRNNITDSNANGLWLSHSNFNNITENTIAKNVLWWEPIPLFYGLNLEHSLTNRIYHNNFIDNGEQAYALDSANILDDGYPSGGNYWSDYVGSDPNQDGIGSAIYEIDTLNRDMNPLVGFFHGFDTSTGYPIDVVSNSTIESFQYFAFNTTIRILVSNMTSSQTHGFCRLTIRHSLVPPPYSVTVNDIPVTPITIPKNATHSILYISYAHSTEKIEIVPEFPSLLILPLFMIATLLVILLYKKRTYSGIQQQVIILQN